MVIDAHKIKPNPLLTPSVVSTKKWYKNYRWTIIMKKEKKIFIFVIICKEENQN
jgi:hypothetical protein